MPFTIGIAATKKPAKKKPNMRGGFSIEGYDVGADD